MKYLMGLLVFSCIIFTVGMFTHFRKKILPLYNISCFKLHYLALGIIFMYFVPDSYVTMFERSREPFIWLCISWIGIYYGCGLELRIHQKFPLKLIVLNIIEPVVILVFVAAAGTVYLFYKHDGWSYTNQVLIAAIFCSFTVFRRRNISEYGSDTSPLPVLNNLLPVRNILPIIILGIGGTGLFTAQEFTLPGYPFTGIFPVVIFNILVGIAGGVLLNMLISGAESTEEISLILAGGAAICGGVAYIFSFSLLFVGTIAGAFLINATLKRLQTLEALNATNEYIERLFLFLLGTMVTQMIAILKMGSIAIVFSALMLFLFSASLSYMVSFSWTSHVKNGTVDPSLIRIGLTGQGILISAAAFECAYYVNYIPTVFILFVAFLFFYQFTVCFHRWRKESP